MAIWDKLLSSSSDQEKKADALWERAIKYFDGKLFNRALKDMSQAIDLNPKLSERGLELMASLSSGGNDEQALSIGLALLKIEKENPELLNQLGNSLRKLGSFGRAKKLYTMAIKLDPKNKNHKYNLAACTFGISTADSELVRQTLTVEAYTELRRNEFLGERLDFYPIPNQVLEEEGAKKGEEEEGGEEEEEMDDESKAQLIDMMGKQLKEDLSASQGAWQDEFNLGLFYDLVGLGELSVQHLAKAVKVDPKNPEPVNNLAVALVTHKENSEKAESLLLESLNKNKFDRTTVLNLAVINRMQGKSFQALKFYVYLGDLLAKSLGDFDTEKAEDFANDLFQRRKYLEAIPFYKNLGKEKQEPIWFEKLAVMYFNQKKEDDYIMALRELLTLEPENIDAAEKISSTAQKYEDDARERMTRGNKRHAIQLFNKSVKIEPTAERWVELVQLYKDDGEENYADFALRQWKKLSGQEEGDEEGENGEESGDESQTAEAT